MSTKPTAEGSGIQEQPPSDVVAAGPTSDEKMWGLLAHISALSGFVIPLANIIGPLAVWSIKRDQSKYVDYHGKESLNFQITITVAYFIEVVVVLAFAGVILIIGRDLGILGLAIFLAIVVGIFNLVMIIIAAFKANSGEYYKYPLTIRFIK